MNVKLKPHLANMLRQTVAAGRYASPGEVVREALRLMEAQNSTREAIRENVRHTLTLTAHSTVPRVGDPTA